MLERDDDSYYDDWQRHQPEASPSAAPSFNQWGLPPNSNRPAGTQDLSAWLARGVTPDQIFDENGQLRPGWTRVASGYEHTGVAPPATTPQTQFDPLPPGGPGPGPSGNLFGPGPQLRSLDSLWPAWNPQSFNAPAPFSYPDFARPSMEDAENEPGYNFAATQGRKGVEATKAAQGVYRSGQTLKDIYAWASEFAKQNYSGVFDRSLRTYDTNRNNAADSYMTNYGIGRDVFDRNYSAYNTGNQGLRQKATLDFGRDWDLYQSDLDTKKFLVGHGDD